MTSLLSAAALLLLALAGSLWSPFVRRIRATATGADTNGDNLETVGSQTTGNAAEDSTPAAAVPVSVIMAVHDDAEALERNLPAFAGQDYSGEFEIIVVDESSSDDTKDVLKLLKSQWPNVYTTFIPESSHYLSRRKLALTLAVKAAKNELIILTDINCRPSSARWLQTMAAAWRPSDNLVFGLTTMSDDTSGYWCYERLMTNCYQMRKAAKGTAYRYCGCALGFRKSTFMSQNGFLHNLMYLRGEYDYTANEHASLPVGGADGAAPSTTAVVIDADNALVQERQTVKGRTYSHLHYLEARRHMQRGTLWRLLFNSDQLLYHSTWAACLAAGVCAALSADWLLCSAAGGSLLLFLVVRTLTVSSAAKDYGQPLSVPLIPFYELRTVWQQLYFLLRHTATDKYELLRR